MDRPCPDDSKNAWHFYLIFMVLEIRFLTLFSRGGSNTPDMVWLSLWFQKGITLVCESQGTGDSFLNLIYVFMGVVEAIQILYTYPYMIWAKIWYLGNEGHRFWIWPQKWIKSIRGPSFLYPEYPECFYFSETTLFLL